MNSMIMMFLPIFLLVILIPIFIGIYVFRDAKRRNMNALLWTLMAILVPGLFGFLIYLLIRGNYSDLHCPQCDTPVEQDFIVCSNCGAKLKPTCPNCGRAVDGVWKICPHCAQPLPEHQSVTPPVHKKDKHLWKILLIVLLIPLILLAFIFLGNFIFTGVGGSSSFREDAREDYFSAQPEPQISDRISSWLNTVDETRDLDRAYALQYTKQVDRNTYQHYFLVHAPGTYDNSKSGIQLSERLFGATAQLNVGWTGYNDGLYSIMMTSSKEKSNLKIVRDGKTLPCTTISVDFNPTLYLNEPSLPYADGDPFAGGRIIPEKMTILQATENGEQMVSEFTQWETDEMHRLLSVIENAPYVKLSDPIYKEITTNDFKELHDGYTIIIELPVQKDQPDHPDTIACHAVKRNSKYYLIDDHDDKGHYIRKIDKGTYAYLESRFTGMSTTPDA